jgi:hypothetical protein
MDHPYLIAALYQNTLPVMIISIWQRAQVSKTSQLIENKKWIEWF